MVLIIQMFRLHWWKQKHLYDWIWPTYVLYIFYILSACLLAPHDTSLVSGLTVKNIWPPKRWKHCLPCTTETLKPITAMSHVQYTESAAGHMKCDITTTPIWLSWHKSNKRHVLQFIMQPPRFQASGDITTWYLSQY